MVFQFFYSYLLIACGTVPTASHASAFEITQRMINRTKEIETLTYVMTRKERLKGKHRTQTASVKLRRNPYMVYTRQIEPKEGQEVLYVEGENSGKALVNPNRFPWIKLKLDPLGKVMRKNQHHTILDSGYDRVVSILEHLIQKYGDEINTMMQLQRDTIYADHPCWIITFKNPDFQFVEYVVQENESLLDIATKRQVNAHMLLECNSTIDSYEDVSSGQKIRIPKDYCANMTIYIDQQRNIPLKIMIYDHLGLYESYAFSEVEIDPVLPIQTFNAANRDYNF